MSCLQFVGSLDTFVGLKRFSTSIGSLLHNIRTNISRTLSVDDFLRAKFSLYRLTYLLQASKHSSEIFFKP